MAEQGKGRSSSHRVSCSSRSLKMPSLEQAFSAASPIHWARPLEESQTLLAMQPNPVSGLGNTVGDTTKGLTDTVGNTTKGVGDTAKGATDSVGSTVGGGGGDNKQTAQNPLGLSE
ncbi:MAG: hypothetical protein Q9167_000275 [Letrouitia subvulpina]